MRTPDHFSTKEMQKLPSWILGISSSLTDRALQLNAIREQKPALFLVVGMWLTDVLKPPNLQLLMSGISLAFECSTSFYNRVVESHVLAFFSLEVEHCMTWFTQF